MSVTIAAIAGSLRAGSHTRALLRAAACDLPPGIRLAVWDGLAHVPPTARTWKPAQAIAAHHRDDRALAVAALAAAPMPDPPLFSTWAARLD